MDMSARERFLSRSTLTCLLQGISGMVTTVELRNEGTVLGRIEHVDGFMNITMSNVCFTDPSGDRNYLDHFFVKGENVRYIQIPDKADISQTISREVQQYGKGSDQCPGSLKK